MHSPMNIKFPGSLTTNTATTNNSLVIIYRRQIYPVDMFSTIICTNVRIILYPQNY